MNLHWTWLDSWIVIIGSLCALACSLVGNFLVLRRMSLMGDAISHAVLPGLAAAFLLTGSRASIPMFVGAVMAGLATAALTEWVRSRGKVDEGASMGVVFTTLFAVGLVLIVRAANTVDLDPGCVLYGAIETAPLDTVSFGDLEIPRAVLVLGGTLILNIVCIGLFFKELTISAFDAALATSLGINARVMHYLLMTLTAVTAVSAFESVGSVLVVAMMVAPAATAMLLSHRLSRVVWISAGVAVASAALGHVGAIAVPGWFGMDSTRTAGMMACAAGTIFVVALVGSPSRGLIARGVAMMRLRGSLAMDDLLGLLYRGRESGEMTVSQESLQAAMAGVKIDSALHRLRRQGLVMMTGDDVGLSERGVAAGERIVRSHRLWETYLVAEVGVRSDHVHGTAERLEHVTTDSMRKELAHAVGEPTTDPHGKSIPSAEQAG